jgi:hypothetical protein
MKSLWNEVDRRDVVSRFNKLTPNTKPSWGRMSAPQVVTHIGDWFRMAIGDLKVESKNTPFRFPVVKQVLVYLAPLPPNLPTAPELVKNDPGPWAEDVRDVRDLIDRAVERSRQRRARWPDHPALGKLSRRAWGVLAYRHTDHHLRQFGL